jgi:hypothetical protein
VARLKTVGKAVLLAFASFLLAALVGRTPVPGSYALAVLVSVILCPLALGAAGARLLKLGPWATVAAVNALPVLSALDDALRLGDPVQVRWLVAAALFSWAGWRLGARGDARANDMAE